MKLWGGRFTGQTDASAHAFHSSLPFDKRLFKEDITGSMAHANMLGRQGIISEAHAELIIKGLSEIANDIDSGQLPLEGDAEDIHSFIETELFARIGEAAKHLHTGRSRNDQVALDMRIYVKRAIDDLSSRILVLLETLLDLTKEHRGTIIPGFTHLQKAQPTVLAHHLLAYVSMLKRDLQRLGDCRARTDSMPLGSGALAGTTFPIDREFLRTELDFSEISANSLDAVSDRDFCIEFVSSLSILMMHLSRFCEELILWSTDSFGFIEISDAFATGSSMMPQKKNPDMAELIRGKTGRVYGSLMGLLTLMKGLPLSYNKDMQEDKEAVFDAADTVSQCLLIFNGMLSSIHFNTQAMYQSALKGYTNATDAADWLVKKGLPFREAHEVTGKLVQYGIGQGKALEELSIDELKSICPLFDPGFFKAISIEQCIEARSVPGGPSKEAINQAIEGAEAYIAHIRKNSKNAEEEGC